MTDSTGKWTRDIFPSCGTSVIALRMAETLDGTERLVPFIAEYDEGCRTEEPMWKDVWDGHTYYGHLWWTPLEDKRKQFIPPWKHIKE